MIDLLLQPAATRLALALVHFLWQGMLIASALAIVVRSNRSLRPQHRYALGLVALGLMIACPPLTYALLGTFEARATPTIVDSTNGQAWRVTNINALPVQTLSTHAFDTTAADIESVTVDRWAMLQPAQAVTAKSGSHVEQVLIATQPAILLAWCCGVLLFALRMASGYAGTLWMRQATITLPAGLTSRVAEIGARLKLDVVGRVFASARVGEAVAVGFWRPVVLLPVSWVAELPPSVLEGVIAHELAHLRRWDLWATAAQRIVESLLFYHPAVWWLSRRVSLDREMCCDELAVGITGKRVAYARILETLGRRTVQEPSLLLAMSFKGDAEMNLLARVKNILGMPTQPDTGRALLAGLAATIAVTVVIALGAGRHVVSAEADREGEARETRREGEADRAKEAPAGERRDAVKLPSPRGEGEREAARPDAPAGERRVAEGERRAAEGTRDGAREPARGEEPRRDGAAREGADRKPDAPRREEADRKPDAPRREDAREGDRREGDRREGASGVDAERANLFMVIKQLQQEVRQLQAEVRELRGIKPMNKDGAREGGEKFIKKDAPREGDKVVKKEPSAKDGAPIKKDAPREGEKFIKKDAPREGEKPVKKDAPREGEKTIKKDAPRDVEKVVKEGARDGDKPVKKDAPRDGDKPGPVKPTADKKDG